MKKHLRVLLLFDIEGPLGTSEEYEHFMATEESWGTEGDVLNALRKNGHEVGLAPFGGHPREIIDHIERFRPDVVWNSVEAVKRNRYFEPHVVGLLELMGVPVTGTGLSGMILAKDKALSKKILRHHRVPVPPFVVSRARQPLRALDKILLPAFVKPIASEGSEGITRDSLADSAAEALKRAAFLHERMGDDVIIEQFIEGRELYVGLLGNRRPKALPIRELRFTKVPEGEPTFASYKAKWDPGYRERWGIQSGFAEELEPPLVATIERHARRAFRVLQLRGYARMDMRLRPDGAVFVMEANPNPEIKRKEDFAESAERAGLPYEALIENVLRKALRVRAR